MNLHTVFTTVVNDVNLYVGDDLETAIRAWDAATYQGGENLGGVQVQSFLDGNMIRDGWILHVRKGVEGETVTYLNPNLALA